MTTLTAAAREAFNALEPRVQSEAFPTGSELWAPLQDLLKVAQDTDPGREADRRAELVRIEQVLNDWLVDNTEEVFEEEPEVDEARFILQEAFA